MNVRREPRGPARASRTSRSSTLLHAAPRPSSCLPHHHSSHPTPCLPALSLPPSVSATSRNRGGFATRLEETKEVVGVHRGRGWKKGPGGVRSEPRSILASPAGWTRPDIAFRNSPSRRYQATLPTSHSTPCIPAAGPSFFLPFVPPWPLGRSSRQTLAICIRRDELRLPQERKFFAPL